MEVIFIGTGCGVPSKRRASPALIIKVKGRPFLFDSGSGTLRRMLEVDIEGNDLSHIFYTHLHVDHTADLPAILFAAKNPLGLREEDLVLVGPKGLGNFYRDLLTLYKEQIVSLHYQVIIEEIEDDSREFLGCKIISRTLPHTLQSIGYRIEDDEGRVVVYSGDTDYCSELLLLAEDADLAILESSFPDGMKVPGHLTPSLAGRIAREAGCKRLALNHLYPVCEGYDVVSGASESFGGEVILAEDLMRIEI